MSYYKQIQNSFKSGDMTMRLIYINIFLFILVAIFRVVLKLFNVDLFYISQWFSVPSNLLELKTHFWTPITYMYYHEEFFHILFNMLMLFWFGKIFVMYFSEKKLLSLYVFGGLVGAFIYVLAYNIFPFYEDSVKHSILMGASGSIMAIILAVAVKAPDMELNLLLLGRVKLKWIAATMILISFFGVTSENGGGEMAHLGGALGGAVFALVDRRGVDITAFISIVINFFVNLFKPKPKIKKTVYHAQKMSRGDYNQMKAQNEKEIDDILDKIKTSGYESLTAEEKRKLFERKR